MRTHIRMLALAAVLSVSCASRVSKAPTATVALGQIVRTAQAETGANYTFDYATSQALNATMVAWPTARIDAAALESVLREAGFRIRPVGPAELRTYLIERDTP